MSVVSVDNMTLPKAPWESASAQHTRYTDKIIWIQCKIMIILAIIAFLKEQLAQHFKGTKQNLHKKQLPDAVKQKQAFPRDNHTGELIWLILIFPGCRELTCILLKQPKGLMTMNKPCLRAKENHHNSGLQKLTFFYQPVRIIT